MHYRCVLVEIHKRLTQQLAQIPVTWATSSLGTKRYVFLISERLSFIILCTPFLEKQYASTLDVVVRHMVHTNYYTRSQNIEARRWPGAAAEASQLLASACQAGGGHAA